MDAVPAVPGSSIADLTGSPAMLVRWRQWVETAMIDADTYNKVKAVQAWIKIHKLAADISVEATRLECTALRRLHQLKATSGLSSQAKSTAEFFGEMKNTEFAEAMEQVSGHVTASGLMRSIRRERDGEAATNLGRAYGTGAYAGVHSAPTADEMADAARLIVGQIFDEGEPTSIHRAAFRLAEHLDLANSFDADTLTRKALREVVRQAMILGQRPVDGAPNFVTYRAAEGGWVHVPFGRASIEQVRFWAAFRRQQAHDVQARADEATQIEALLDCANAVTPDVTSAADLWEMAMHPREEAA